MAQPRAKDHLGRTTLLFIDLEITKEGKASAGCGASNPIMEVRLTSSSFSFFKGPSGRHLVRCTTVSPQIYIRALSLIGRFFNNFPPLVFLFQHSSHFSK